MTTKMSKTFEEYLANSGWSSSKFLEHAKAIYSEFSPSEFTFGRSVVYLQRGNTKLKFYVHYKGKSADYMSLTDSNGNELHVYHYTCNVSDIVRDIKTILGR